MSTILLWIGLPLILGALLLAIPGRRKLSAAAASLLSLALAALAFGFPEEHVFILGGQRYEFATSLVLLGRTLTITKANLSFIGLLYCVCFMWNAFSNQFKVSAYFNALSMVITALWTAVPAFEPFLYSAVLVQLVVLVSVPLLSPQGQPAGPGLLRYLVLQSLALPFILLSGWMLSGIATAPSVNPLIIRSAMMILVGFALWLAVFPLHTWISMLGQESHPWVLSFLLTVRQSTLLVYLLGFFDRYAWLRGMPNIDGSLQTLGVLLIALAGMVSAFQRDLRRIFAYMFLAETGYALLALGLRAQGALPYMAMAFVPRAFFYWLWGYVNSLARDKFEMHSLVFEDLRGFFHRQPLLSMAWVLILLGISGLPLLAYYPVKRYIWLLLGQLDFPLSAAPILGLAGMLFLTLRLLRTLILPSPQAAEPLKLRLETQIVLAVAFGLVLVMGFFPHFFMNSFQGLLLPFQQLLGVP